MTAVPWRNGAGSGLTLTYSYDDLGRAVDTYKGHLLEKRTYPNDVYLTHLDNNGQNLSGYGYDTFGRLKNHRWKDDGGTLLGGWSHEYDRIGNKKYQEDLQSATQSELYGYDTVYRLDDFKRGQLNEQKTDVTNPTRTQTWTLDPLGNWDETDVDSVTETRVHNDVNELTQRTIGQGGAIDLSYDDAGNLVQDGSANGDHQYVWDYRNRLVQAKEKQDGNWNTVGTYKYDPQGRRVRKVTTNKGTLNGTTRFLWGGDSDWQCLEERDGSDSLVARFTYSPGYIDAVAVQERDLNSDTDFTDTNEVVYYGANTLFSVLCLSDPSGSVVERYRFDAYGGCTVLDADGSADGDGLSDVKNPYVFTGRRLDLESGLIQYRHRYYSPALGRFASRDPIGYAEGHSLYAGLGDRPTFGIDPLGYSTVVEVGNPMLPHFFTVTEAEGRVLLPMVITGTVWEVYDKQGRTTFREGIADARRLQGTFERVLENPILGWRGFAGLGMIAWSGRTMLDAYYGSEGYSDYWWGHAHCVNTCLISRIHPWGPWGAWIAGDIKEVADVVACLIWQKDEACYSAWQESDFKCNARGIIAAAIADWRYGKSKDLIDAFAECVVLCERLKCGPRDGPSAPGPFGPDDWTDYYLEDHPDYRPIPPGWISLPAPGEPQ